MTQAILILGSVAAAVVVCMLVAALLDWLVAKCEDEDEKEPPGWQEADDL